ncbi:protein glxC [Paraburkholderia phymatum]|uniref:Glutamate synthase alpha subunit domain protein n=1 Tax=Paraburkholderia phymatum (strain DSM 17167 / CIP 108236 / LMG 21445 / STM815) TaxID=391038 RepID=B2JVK7_PARP8|nr:protein glxC [Paraburkholderia phymatum]ACC74984.1 glutamate synthase alpha subunit domain protein [Paraburkholderia phymatum STM815]
MDSVNFDLASASVTDVNGFLHREAAKAGTRRVLISNPDGAHNIAVGIDCPIEVEIDGHAGYYAAGMNKEAKVTISGSASTGVAENMMSGRVHVKGFASNAAGASAHGGLLVIEGDAGLRCGISLKGADIVVKGSVGSFSAFMAQAGRIVICGDAGDALGDSLYEAVIYVRGKVKSLGADAREEPMQPADVEAVAQLLRAAGPAFAEIDPKEFRRVASARSLYHWNADANQEY